MHTALGIRQFKQARYAESEAHLRKALERLTAGYAAPRDGEPYYYLGLALREQGRNAEAADAFSRRPGAWPGEDLGTSRWRSSPPGARDLAAALDLVDRSLESNALSTRAHEPEGSGLAPPGTPREALKVLAIATSKGDPLDVRSMAERWLATGAPEDARSLTDTMMAHPATATETAAEYQSAGLWDDGQTVLARLVPEASDSSRLSPLVLYDLGFFSDKLGAEQHATEYRRLARKISPDYVFPFQAEAIAVLRSAMTADPGDPRAPYYLGNLLFDWQPEEAVKLWEQSAALDPSVPMVHRNLAIAWSHRAHGNDLGKAIAALKKAVSLPGQSPLHFAELDELYQAAGIAPEQRLKMFEAHQETVARRAEALSREIALLVFAGRYDEAIRLMTGRRFEVWEGGSLSVAEDWVNAHILKGRQHRLAGRYSEALANFMAAQRVPENLPSDEGGSDNRKSEIAYEIGLAYDAQGDHEKARQSWQVAAMAEASDAGRGRRPRFSGAVVERYDRAMALRKLGQVKEAETIFRRLIEEPGLTHRPAPSEIARSASVTAQQAQRNRLSVAHYTAGLGYLGLGEPDKARQELHDCLTISPDHLGAKTALESLENPQ